MSAKQTMHIDYSDVFKGIGCLKGTSLLHIKDDAKPYQATMRYVAYAIQEPLRKELYRLQVQQILTAPGVHETVEWYLCHSA